MGSRFHAVLLIALLASCTRFGFAPAHDRGGRTERAAAADRSGEQPRLDRSASDRLTDRSSVEGRLADRAPSERGGSGADRGIADTAVADTRVADRSVADKLAADKKPPVDQGPTGPVAPVLSWAKRFGSAGFEQLHALAVDASGNLYLAGRFSGTIDFGGAPLTSAGQEDIFLASFTPTGQHRFSARFGGTGLYDVGTRLAVDASGNVFLTGYFETSAAFGGGALTTFGLSDVFLASFTSSGAHRFSKRFGSNGWDEGWGLALDGSGNVYLSGTFSSTADFGGNALASAGGTDIFLASYANDGAHRFSVRFGSTGYDGGEDLAVDAAGHVYLAGRLGGPVDLGGGVLPFTGQRDAFIAGFTSASGQHRFSRSFGGTAYDAAHAVAADASGNVYVAGEFAGTANFGGGPVTSAGSDIFLVSYDSNGAYRFAKPFGQTALDAGHDLAVDGKGNLYLAGEYNGTVDFGGGPLTTAADDALLAGFTGTGVHLFSRRYGGAQDDSANAVAVDGSGNIYCGGLFFGAMTAGTSSLVSVGSSDIFLVKLLPQ